MGKINACDKIMIKNQKNMEIKETVNKYPSKRWFRNRIRSLLRQADARRSADIIYSATQSPSFMFHFLKISSLLLEAIFIFIK